MQSLVTPEPSGPGVRTQRSRPHTLTAEALAAETWHSAMLLGGALGVMSLLALVMFVLTGGLAA